MDQDRITAVLKAVTSLLMPFFEQQIKEFISLEIDRQIKDQTDIDRELVTAWIKDEIESLDIDQSISDWMDTNFDISDHESGLDINDRISDYMSDNLRDHVRDEVRDLSFSVIVE